jgi:hypothetical protein
VEVEIESKGIVKDEGSIIGLEMATLTKITLKGTFRSI